MIHPSHRTIPFTGRSAASGVTGSTHAPGMPKPSGGGGFINKVIHFLEGPPKHVAEYPHYVGGRYVGPKGLQNRAKR